MIVRDANEAALRLTLAWFGFLPVQRGLNVVGGGLLALSLLLAIGSRADGFAPLTGGVILAGLLGAVFILITPVFCCGTMLRHISALDIMYLRPNFRAQVLYGTTLAITLMAAIAALPILFVHLGASSAPITRLGVAEAFAIAWACVALFCIASFIASAYARTTLLLVMLSPMVITLTPTMVVSIRQYLPGVGSGLMIAVLTWIVFAVWYLRARNILPPENPLNIGIFSRKAVAQRPAVAHDVPASRTAALRHYLGIRSPLIQVLLGTAMLLPLLGVMRTSQSPEGARQVVMMNLIFLSVFGGPPGFLIVRRARLLWLRAGVSREKLFRITERMGMTSLLLPVGVLATGLAASFLIQRPDAAAHILLGMLAPLSLAPFLFYGCLGFTGKWTPVDVLLGIALIVWLAIVAAITHLADTIPSTLLMLLATSAVLTWLLRQRALRRWRRLDWCITRAMPMFDR